MHHAFFSKKKNLVRKKRKAKAGDLLVMKCSRISSTCNQVGDSVLCGKVNSPDPRILGYHPFFSLDRHNSRRE